MKWLSIVFALLMVSVAFAHTEVEDLVKSSNGKTLPGAIGTLFGNDRINVYVNETNSTEQYNLVTQDKTIVEANKGELSDPTVKVYVDETTLNLILNSGSQEALLEAFDNGSIRYEGVTLPSKVKLFFVGVGIWIAGLF